MSLIVGITIAFGGGVFASIIGAIASFIIASIVALSGIVSILCGGSDVLLMGVAFGPFFAPHVALTGALAATAFAGRKSQRLIAAGKTDSYPVIHGANLTTSLFNTMDPSVLLVGGIVGIAGYLSNYLFSTVLALPIDTISLTVGLLSIVIRLIIGSTGLFRKVPAGEKRFHFTPKSVLFTAIWSFGLACAVSYVCIQLNMNFVGFALCGLTFIFMYMGKEFPPTHHVGLMAGYAGLAFGNIWIAGLVGVIAALFGDVVIGIFNTDGDTHVDMPSIVMSVISLIILVLFS